MSLTYNLDKYIICTAPSPYYTRLFHISRALKNFPCLYHHIKAWEQLLPFSKGGPEWNITQVVIQNVRVAPNHPISHFIAHPQFAGDDGVLPLIQQDFSKCFYLSDSYGRTFSIFLEVCIIEKNRFLCSYFLQENTIWTPCYWK